MLSVRMISPPSPLKALCSGERERREVRLQRPTDELPEEQMPSPCEVHSQCSLCWIPSPKAAGS